MIDEETNRSIKKMVGLSVEQDVTMLMTVVVGQEKLAVPRVVVLLPNLLAGH